MIEHLPPLAKLVRQLQQIPYLASKNLYRVANYMLAMDAKQADLFCKSLFEAQQSIVKCQICCVWKELDKGCLFCSSQKRDKSVICVVETWHELMAIEKTRGFTGLYHVLGGVICPLEGIGPEDLSITTLLGRITDEVKEVILATNQTPEGEATASFIAHKLKGKPVAISCLARGIPVGSQLESMDHLTVYKALSERRPF